MIHFEGVSKHYSNSQVPAVNQLNMQVSNGEICVLVGPSGCGKTTTLRMINRLEVPTQGRVLVDGHDVAQQDVIQLRRRIGYVMQHAGLFPHRRVADNIATVPRLMRWSSARIKERIDELVELVGLDPAILKRFPHQLSGGQQSRVGLARALAANPPILLLDEPFAAIDPVVRERLQGELLALHRKVNKTMVLVTHDIDEAMRLGDRIAIFREGGVLAQFDTPQRILSHPADEFVASFLGPDRELKRLALMQAAEIQGHEAMSVDQALEPLEYAGVGRPLRTPYRIVLNDQRQPVAWLDQCDNQHAADQVVQPTDNLRSVLSSLMEKPSEERWLIRVDTVGRYAGVITPETLYEALTQTDTSTSTTGAAS